MSPSGPARLAVSSRGDALTHYLTSALAQRYDVRARIDMDLSATQRLLVAASTFRPARRLWAERYYKSGLGYQLRSLNGARQLRTTLGQVDVTLQVHALFQQQQGTHVIYVDCTHRQAAEHWVDWNPLRGRALRQWYDRERQQYLRAGHVFAFSQQTAQSLMLDYDVPAHRVSVVGAGVNFDRLPLVPDRSASHAPTILFIGNDFVRKGGEVLLRSFAEVRRQIPDARLRIVGTAHRLPERAGVEILGRVTNRERVGELYADADVFALPSLFDPFPLVLLEAMAYGLACVATPTCGVPEIVVDGQTGRLTGIGNVEALTAALVTLLRDPEQRLQLGRAGRRRAESQFLWTHVVDRMSPALDTLVPQAGQSARRRTSRS